MFLMFASSKPSPIPAKNRLLAALPLEEYERLFPDLECVSSRTPFNQV
ncbi:hypothetical protein [Chroococcidiopsis sp [FACHB-1243]]|nr:hypothetical protein [Chroococcidiopsis sp. [FACHB-1243]]